MSLPHEQLNAIVRAEDFLMRLQNRAYTKRIPQEIRDEARRIWRHFPGLVTMACDGKKIVEEANKKMEDTR